MHWRSAAGMLSTAVLDLVFPRSCAACGAAIRDEPGHVCWDCFARLTVIVPPFCRLCGDPIEGRVEGEALCALCARHAPAFDLARSAIRYRGPARELLHAFKYSHGTHLRGDMAALLEACVRTHFSLGEIDGVAFVPLHAVRERERTYNQAHLLAEGLARRLRRPVAARCVARVRPTSTQTHLTAPERRENMRNAFDPLNPAWLDGRRILLVDDVMTTGATVDACARALKAGGAARVFVVTVARG